MTDGFRVNNVLSRQIPYAIGQFTVNELCHETAFRSMSEETRRTLSSTSKFTIQLGSGIIAGFAAAILSHVSICRVGSLHPDCLTSETMAYSQRIPY
jgi:hypothetical protein